MPQLTTATKELGLSLLKMGDLRNTTEGTEQDWKCCDDSGDLFFFSTCEVNEDNGLRLKAGTFCIISGPGARGRKRKEMAEAYERFERALAGLGVHRMGRK
jgi:hypothetical protein